MSLMRVAISMTTALKGSGSLPVVNTLVNITSLCCLCSPAPGVKYMMANRVASASSDAMTRKAGPSLANAQGQLAGVRRT